MISRTDAEHVIAESDGILTLEPALVARDWMTPGRRLGLDASQYEVGDRGWICERWLASTTPAGNAVTFEGEGISLVRSGDARIRLDELVAAAPELIMGSEYAATHSGLGRLAKIFDYGDRVPFHIHPPTAQAQAAGLQSKDEAYYFLPGVDLGPHPESFFGVHPSLSQEEASDLLIEHLTRWNDDHVLSLSRGFHLYPEGGYFVPSGVLHAPGTALTLELQEDSDAMAFLQATCGDVHLSKELLLGAFDAQSRSERGERVILDWIDWDLNLMADFHSQYSLTPRTITETDGVNLDWLFWGGSKFSSKRLRLAPGASTTLRENGVYSLFVWTGDVTVGVHALSGGQLGSDELLITHRRAVEGVTFENTGSQAVELILFFGPDLNPDSPQIQNGAQL